LLPGVDDGQYLDRLGHLIDEDVIGVDQRLTRAGNTAGAIGIGMVRQALDGMMNGVTQALGGRRIALGNIGRDVTKVTCSCACR
jgi:hypothetical protein